jgi:hypothetical protein
MSSIIRVGDTFHGISVESRGVFTNDQNGATYAGQCRDGYVCGLGVVTYSNGLKEYAEHGPDGQYDGRYLFGWAFSTFYRLYERGQQKDEAVVYPDGGSKYNGVVCAPDDPRLLALIAQVAPVEVRPAAPAPHPPLSARPPPGHQAIVRWIGRLVLPPRRRSRRPWPPRCIPTPHAVAGRCATQPDHQSHCKARPRSDACTDRFAEVVTREALLHPNNRRLVHTKGPSRQLRCHATVQHAAVPNAATRGGLCCFATPLGLTG